MLEPFDSLQDLLVQFAVQKVIEQGRMDAAYDRLLGRNDSAIDEFNTVALPPDAHSFLTSLLSSMRPP